MVDIKDVPRDRALPWLSVAADPLQMQARLQPHFGDEVKILQVKLERFTYKPGRNARFSYRIKLRDRARDRKAKHVVHGRMETPGDSAALYRKMSRRTWVTPAYGPALLHLEDLGIVLWGFPNDPKLEGVERVAQPHEFLAVAATVPSLARFAGGSCDSQVVKYVPGKRLVMKHALTNPDGDATIVYTKTYGHDRGGAIFAVMRSLWESAQADPHAFTAPEPLAYVAAAHTLLLGGLPGTAAIGTLQNGALAHGMMQAGSGVAGIHTSGVGGLEPWTEAHEFENFLGVTAMLQRYDADLAPAVERLRRHAQEAMASVEALPPVPIHGAFRFTQLLTYRERLALVDFDGFREGHPMCDVGSFAAHLYYLMAKDELDAADAERAVHDFLEAYRHRAPWGTPEAALRWYTAVILVAKHAQKCVKRLKDDGDSKIRHMLELADELLTGQRPLR